MAGANIKCLAKNTIDFSTVAVGFTQEIVLRQAVPTIQWREATFMVRVYAHTLAGGTNTVLFGEFPQSVSTDDPGVVFLDPTGATTTCLVSASTPAPTILTAPAIFTAPPTVQLYAIASRFGSGQISVTFSIDICGKDV
jgi:hypothetical protein